MNKRKRRKTQQLFSNGPIMDWIVRINTAEHKLLDDHFVKPNSDA